MILSPALPRWPPVLLQGSWCRTPLLSFSCPLITFQPPTQKLDFVRFFIVRAYSFKKENKKTLSLTSLCKSRLLKLHRIGRLVVLFPGYLVKILTFTFPSQPARQNNNKPSDRQVHLRLFYTQTPTRSLRAALIGSNVFQRVWPGMKQAGKQEVCISWAGDREKGVSGSLSQ